MNCEEADASMTTVPPRTAPVPRMVKGSDPAPASSTATPSAASAPSTSPTGRLRMCSSPSKETEPVESPAIGGTKRITVPASPQSTWASAVKAAGLTSQSSDEVSTRAPRAVSPSAIRSVSRERSAWPMTEGPSASAARMSARLVSDLLPGSDTVRSTGVRARGAGQGSAVTESMGASDSGGAVTRAGYRLPARV